MLIWTIISFIVLVHVFKIRYLNYYDELINEEKVDTKNDKKKEEKSKIKKIELLLEMKILDHLLFYQCFLK